MEKVTSCYHIFLQTDKTSLQICGLHQPMEMTTEVHFFLPKNVEVLAVTAEMKSDRLKYRAINFEYRQQSLPT